MVIGIMCNKKIKLAVLAASMLSPFSINTALASCPPIADAANEAMNLHMQLAAAVPDVESLFDPSGNCFSTLSQITDLSSAIPSMGAIINAATSTVQSYLTQQACTAVNDMSAMVTDPINEKINLINGNISTLSSLTGELHSSGGLSFISPDFIGQGSGSDSGATVTIGVNHGEQALTNGGDGTVNFGDITDSINQTMTEINSVATESMQVQMQAYLQQREVDRARAALNSCNDASCGGLQDAYEEAQRELDELNDRYAELAAELEALTQEQEDNLQTTPAPRMMPGVDSLHFEAIGVHGRTEDAPSTTRPLVPSESNESSDEDRGLGSLLF